MTNGDSPAEGGLSDFFGRALDNLQGGNFASEPEPARESVSRHPAQIGPYKILRVVGQGGMGTVYLAEQDTPRRVVALKVIRAGFSGHEAERRFQRETEALGRLQHPGIAQIYNAGTADTGSGPQPYFAMEYIDGNPLLKYAKAISEGLPDTGVPASRLWPRHIQSRLELMVMICEAVQHAHRRGIIHRDLKPGNILVDRSGQPKILDFGVARMMDADASLTRQTDLGQLVGTLAYMSPEQAEGDPLAVDMRSDVYALGLILYELLAGKLPYEVSRAALQEAIRVIREEDPAPLSSIDRAFRGDIETIVAKTLEKDKERRYASAGDLAEDLKHHLRSEPIVARAPSALYQLQKFSQRNRALVAGTTAVMVALLGGAVVSTWQAVRARAAEKTALVQKSLAEQAGQKAIAGQELATAERARAERERNLAVESQTVALRERNSAIAEKRRADEQTASATAINTFLQKDLLAQADIANQGLGRLDPDLKVRTALDRAAAGIGGRFEGQPLVEATVRKTIGEAYQSLGVLPEARKQFERERELRQKAQGAEHAQTLECLLRLADLSDLQGRYQEGYTLAAETLKTLERTTKPDDDVRLKGMSGVAAAEEGLGRYTQALQIRNQVLAARRRNSGPEAPATLYEMAEVATNLASQNRLAEAEVMDRQIYEIRRRVLGPENPSTVGALLNIAAVVDEQKKFAEAEKLDLEILEIQRRVRGPDHPETLAAMNNLAIVYREEGKLTESERLLVETLTGKRKQFGPEHPSTLITMGNLASNYLSQRRFAESQALYRQSLEARRRTLGPDHQSTQVAIQNLALAYAQDRRFGEAEAQFHDLAESARRSGDPASRPLQSAMRGLALMLARQANAMRRRLRNGGSSSRRLRSRGRKVLP